MKLATFFTQHPVFHHDEIKEFIEHYQSGNINTLKALLQYHVNKQHIKRIKRGYYAVVAPNQWSGTIAEDPILIAGRVESDAVISHHSALSFHNLAYSLLNTTYFSVPGRSYRFTFEEHDYQAISYPKMLMTDDYLVETQLVDRQGLDVRVTSIERTLVDCLHQLEYAGGLEELWHAGQALQYIDAKRIINYAKRLGNATTLMKVAVFLEYYQASLEIDEVFLTELEKLKPKNKHYMLRNRQVKSTYLSRWHLIVPNSIVHRQWQENNDDHH